MTTQIDKAFNDIEENFKKISEKNKDTLEAVLIKPIHEKYPFAQNGICAMIASMGSGKSYNYLKFIAKQKDFLQSESTNNEIQYNDNNMFNS